MPQPTPHAVPPSPPADALLPSPAALGLPAHFATWRRGQDQAVLDLVSAETRFVMAIMPTGGGKTCTYLSAAALREARTAVLTRTKALQGQILRDFEEMGVVSVQGMNAYRCLALEPGGELYDEYRHLQAPGHVPGCDDGPCRSGIKCSLRESGCLYYDAVEEARQARVVVTNYSFWMFQRRYGKGIGTFDFLVLDEAHEAQSAVSDFLTVELEPWEMQRVHASALAGHATVEQWIEWASFHYKHVSGRLATLNASIADAATRQQPMPAAAVREARELQRIAIKFEALQALSADWLIAEGEGGRWRFVPVWPAAFAPKVLFDPIPHVLLTSATVRPTSARYLGIAEDDLTVYEYPSAFAVETRPCYYIPTARVQHRMSQADEASWLRRIDQIIRGRLDRKGIIHTVSYARAKQVLLHSQFADHMIVHGADRGGAKLAIQRFKLADPPAILVSPSATTGHDFPFDLCRYQIIAKVPFPDSRDPLLAMRSLFDPEYGMYLTLQTLVQAYGRSTRDEQDFSETFVIDDQLVWIMAKYRHLMPAWFLEAVERRATIPTAPTLSPRQESAS